MALISLIPFEVEENEKNEWDLASTLKLGWLKPTTEIEWI